MSDDVLETAVGLDPDEPEPFELSCFCLPCGRRLAERGPYVAEPDRPGHWDGPMPRSVKAGIAWWVAALAVATGLVAAAAWVVTS